MSVRTALADRLRTDWKRHPVLGAVKVTATERALDAITVPTVLIRQTSIGRAPSAPMSHWQVGLLLTLISPHTDLSRAGNQLDDLVPAALAYLDPRFIHEDATAVGYADRLAYDIPLSILAPKE